MTDREKLEILRLWAEEEAQLPDLVHREHDLRATQDRDTRVLNARLLLEVLDGRLPNVFKGRFRLERRWVKA